MKAFDVVLVLLAFALGFTVLRANLCTVACLRGLILQRHYEGMLGLAVASSIAGLVLLGSFLLLPMYVMLPVDSSAWTQIIVGGVILGSGALINGACYLGSITYLGTGNLNFLFTLLGIGLSLRFGHRLPDWSTVMMSGSRMRMGYEVFVGCGAFMLILAFAIWTAVRSRKKAEWLSWYRPWPWPLAAAVCGLLAGLVFARHPNWSYGSAIESLAYADLRPVNWFASASAFALFLGAIASAWLLHRFKLKRITVLQVARCLLGGALMAYAATLIPGGNDGLLLWSIPGLALYGLLAYGAMVTTVAMAIAVERWIRASRSTQLRV